MLCETCNEREAKMHITDAGAKDGFKQRNLYEECYQVFELAEEARGKKRIKFGWTSYSPPDGK